MRRSSSPITTGAGGLARGLRAAFRGLGAALGNRDVRRTYLRFTLVMLVATAATSALMIAGVWALTDSLGDGGFWSTAGLWALRVAGIAISVIAAPVLALLAIDVVLPLLSESIFFAGLRKLAPRRAAALEARPGLPLLVAARVSITLFLYFLGITALAFLAGLIPVAGIVLGPALQIWLTARIVGWELLDPWFDKQEMVFSAQRAYVRRHASAITGFGLPCSMLLAIPLAGPLFFGLAQAAAPALVVDVLDPG